MFLKCKWKTKKFSQLKKSEIIQSAVLFKIKNLLHLCSKKLSALFFFSIVFFKISEWIVFIFSLQNCFDLAILYFFDFEIKSVNDNNSFIYLFKICVSSSFSMIFFMDGIFDFFVSVNSVVNLKNSFSAYKNKSVETFSSNDSNISIALQVKEQNLMNRKLTNFFQTFSYSDTESAFSFNEENVSNFLKTYNKICKAHSIINKNKIRRLHQYCTSVIN